jgi:hypothetical protein
MRAGLAYGSVPHLEFNDEGANRSGYVSLEGSSFRAGVRGFGSHPLVALRDDDVPRRRGFDVRTDGLWVSITCETPGEHWSVGMEAFAVGYEQDEATADERGDIVALGFDLEWERAGEGWRVYGDVLVGADRYEIDAVGSLVAEEG